MAVYDHEEQEQLSRIKAWWESYGTAVTTLIVTVAVAALGWQGFQWYQNKQAREASGIYFALERAAEEGSLSQVQNASGRLISDYPRTLYAEMGALMAAGIQVAQGERDGAREPLEWLVANGREVLLKDIARLRLATLLLDEGAHSEALAQLESEPAPALRARHADLRGDILAAQGHADQARAAYQEALDALRGAGDQTAAALAEVVRIKLESLEARG